MVGASLLLPYFTLQPMKMELIDGSETSAIINQMPGNYPKGNLVYEYEINLLCAYICGEYFLYFVLRRLGYLCLAA